MSDQQLQQLKREVMQGDAPIERFLAAECRAKGHDWEVVQPSPPEWLYVLMCHRCLLSKGKHLFQVNIPEMFTVTIHTDPTNTICPRCKKNHDPIGPCNADTRHIITSANHLNVFSTICGQRVGLAPVHSREMRLQVKEILDNCHQPADCALCLAYYENWKTLPHFRTYGPEVYRALFRVCAFAVVDGMLDVLPEWLKDEI